MAYIKVDGTKKHCCVLDGIPGKAYDGMVGVSFVFSHDGRSAAYVARRGSKLYVVVQGNALREYELDEIAMNLALSADGRRYNRKLCMRKVERIL